MSVENRVDVFSIGFCLSWGRGRIGFLRTSLRPSGFRPSHVAASLYICSLSCLCFPMDSAHSNANGQEATSNWLVCGRECRRPRALVKQASCVPTGLPDAVLVELGKCGRKSNTLLAFRGAAVQEGIQAKRAGPPLTGVSFANGYSSCSHLPIMFSYHHAVTRPRVSSFSRCSFGRSD